MNALLLAALLVGEHWQEECLDALRVHPSTLRVRPRE